MYLQWPDQIHANDSILTFGYSETVLVFLLEAAKKLDFQVDPLSKLENCTPVKILQGMEVDDALQYTYQKALLMCFE